MTVLYAIVNRDEEEIWAFRYHHYEDAEEIAKELRRVGPPAEVMEVKRGREEEQPRAWR